MFYALFAALSSLGADGMEVMCVIIPRIGNLEAPSFQRLALGGQGWSLLAAGPGRGRGPPGPSKQPVIRKVRFLEGRVRAIALSRTGRIHSD